jgi:hypothetical protein
MNILDNISQAWTEGEETGILCVDFNKAFDSVEHYVIKEVLDFFGFGEYMTNTILTLLKGRQGVVLLSTGFSKKFDIKRGTPQGDRTSPYVFILCIEILLLHLRLVATERGGMHVRYTELLRLQRGLEGGLIEAYADVCMYVCLLCPWAHRKQRFYILFNIHRIRYYSITEIGLRG